MSTTDRKTRAKAAIRGCMLGGGQRTQAQLWDVPRSYIQRRLEGVPTRAETNAAQQLLSPALEAQLALWAVGQARLGFAPAFTKFRIMAQNMVRSGGSVVTLGKNWHRRFLERNPSVRVTRSHIMQYQRVDGASVANINIFFDRLEAPEIAEIPPDRWYNSDEMGIGQGVGGDHWILAEAGNHVALKKDVEKGEWITALETVSGSGVVLPPLVIFKGADVQAQWFPDRNNAVFDAWRFRTSENGWTSNSIALEWFQDLFLPHIRATHGNKWVVLVCDGHDSHTNDEFLWACLTNKVWLVFYEPHCSHVVQVVDVGVFGLVKKALRAHLRDSPSARIGLKPSKPEVITAFQKARTETMTPVVIKNAWATAGIWPRNREKPLSSRFVILHEAGIARKRAEEVATQERPKTPTFLEIVNPTPVKTPSRGQELLQTGRKLALSKTPFNSTEQRLWNIKAAKALDNATARIAELETSNMYLRAKLNSRENKTRKKVKIAPGKKFVRMADIRRAKRRIRSRVIYEDEAEDFEVPGRNTPARQLAWEMETEIESTVEVGYRSESSG